MKVILFTLISISIVIALNGFYGLVLIDKFDSFILLINFLYIIVNLLYLYIYRKKNIFCPEFILSITFYFACFTTSVFSSLEIPTIYIFTKNEVIRSISLALFGWTLFLLGAIIANYITQKKNQHINIPDKFSRTNERLFFIYFSTFMLIYFFINDAGNYVSRYKDGGELSHSQVWFTIFIIISSIYEFRRLNKQNIYQITSFIKNVNKLFLFNFVVIVFFLLITGNRSEALQIVLPIIFLFHIYVRKFSNKQIVLYISVAWILFSIIREVRIDNDISFTELINIQSISKDFLSINSAIPVLVDYTNKHGSATGQNLILQIISIVPFLQGIVLEISNFQPAPDSSTINTIMLYGSLDYGGAGTNIIGDLYYTFDIYGVIIGMFFAGYTFVLLFNKFKRNNLSPYQYIAFLILFGNIIYFVRIEYLFILRMISFSIITLFLVKIIFSINNLRNQVLFR